MNKPEKLILDYSTWRCGDKGDHTLGDGDTALRNDQGFMCCLGQWSIQCGANVDELIGRGEPSEIETPIHLFVIEQTHTDYDFDPVTGEEVLTAIPDGKTNTVLAIEAMSINDNSTTTPEEKIIALTELLANAGVVLEVINKPSK